MIDWLGTGAKSARTFGENIITECIRRVKLAAKNDPNFVVAPVADNVSTILAARMFRQQETAPLAASVADASSIIAAQIFGKKSDRVFAAPYLVAPTIVNGLTMLGSNTTAQVAGRIVFTGNTSVALGAGQIGREASTGLTVWAATGTLYDFFVASVSLGNALALLTGTRDFQAFGTITAVGFIGPLTGNATTATTLQTARAINGVNFDGSAPITVTAAAGTLTGATLAAGVTASSLTSVGTLTGLVLGSGVAPSLPNTGAAPTAGTLTLVIGTKTVNTTAVVTGDLLFFQRISTGGTIGFATTYTINSGVSFTISSDSALDTSTYGWFIVRVH